MSVSLVSSQKSKVLPVVAFCAMCSLLGFAEGDSLVSDSYLQSWKNTTESNIQKAVQSELDANYDAKIAEIQQSLRDIAYLREQFESDAQTMVTDAYTYGQEISLSEGNLITVSEGIWYLGTTGVVIDLTTGVQVGDGILEIGHQYLVAENSRATVLLQESTGKATVLGGYSVSTGSVATSGFVDVAMWDWFYNPVNFVTENGLFSGVSSTTFSPYTSMDRGMMMTVMYRLASSPVEEMNSATETFYDVADTDWFAPYVRWGATQHLTAGVGEGYFAPRDTVTRQQVLVMLHAFSRNYLGLDLDVRGDVSGYQDLGYVSEWAIDSVQWAVAYDLLVGIPDGDTELLPWHDATRADVATILMNFSQAFLK